jgi:hypothetical protein
MKYFLLLISIVLQIGTHAHAASLSLVQTSGIETGKVSFDVMLDPETESINAFSGALSIPSEYMDIDSISTSGGIASFWLVSPRISKERDFNKRSRIMFEGVLPGGFDGVRSPYYEGVRPGKLFSVTLKPIQSGNAIIVFENIDLRLHDGKATKIIPAVNQLAIAIPDIKTLPRIDSLKREPKELTDISLQGFLAQDESVDNGKWMLIIRDEAIERTPTGYFVAESKRSNPREIKKYEWKEASNPYILKYQSRNRFIHMKAEYSDTTYGFATIAPVENIDTTRPLSRILILIVIAFIFAYAFYTHRTQR